MSLLSLLLNYSFKQVPNGTLNEPFSYNLIRANTKQDTEHAILFGTPLLSGQGRKPVFSATNKILTHQPIIRKNIVCKTLNLILF